MGMPVFCQRCARSVIVTAGEDGQALCPGCGMLLAVPATCDVFISHASEDAVKAEEMADALEAAGISYWLARHDVEAGDSFLDAIDVALAGAKVVVLILSSAATRSPWVLREITLAVGRGCCVVPQRIEEFELRGKFAFLLSDNQWKDAAAMDVDAVVLRVQRQLLKAASVPSPTRESTTVSSRLFSPLDPENSPYVGPMSFPRRSGNRFFGRHHEAEALLGTIKSSRLVLLYAPSGSGKSSLLNTLIFDNLNRQGVDVLMGARVGVALPETFKAAQIRNVFTFAAIYGMDDRTVPDPQCRLVDYFRTIDREGSQGRVVVFDQFEELFTQHAERPQDKVEFLNELVAALDDDPTLRVILAMRKEYLADVLGLTAKLPAGLTVKRFALNPLGPEGALAAITQPAAPFATFAPGVAERIVDQLNTIKSPGFDGVVVESRGEFVEMVHLQIVCQRLWRNLPPGITCIEQEHVNRAAGEGKSLDEFVVNALNTFYDDTITEVANSRATREHGGYSRELIHLGCLKFVTTASTRTMVQRTRGRTGRLPDWIVEQLENSHLLRSERRGGDSWYELAHDRLAEPVGRQLDPVVSARLYAADLLDTMLENSIVENGGNLTGYFDKHDDILSECEPFHSQVGLFPDEEEFVFRASLVAGEQMREWSRRLDADYPQLREQVLRDALNAGAMLEATSPSVDIADQGTSLDDDPLAAAKNETLERLRGVRRNAASLLGLEPILALSKELVRLALSDADTSVRRAAAASLARLDQREFYAEIGTRLNDAAMMAEAQTALSNILVVADRQVKAPQFDSWFRELSSRHRRKIRRQSWALRLNEALPVLPFIVVPAAVLSALSAALFKWLPSIFNWALTQNTASPGMGFFHGLSGGVMWGGCITLGITLHYMVFNREHSRRSYLRPLGSIIGGALFGFIGSAMIVLVVVSVFEPRSLVGMGWIGSEQGRFGKQFWADLFLWLRYGWVQHVIGIGLGIGMALMTNGILASGEWSDFLKRQTSVTGLRQSLKLLRGIIRVAVRHAWPIPLMITLSAVLAYFVPHRTMPNISEKAIETIAAYTKELGTELSDEKRIKAIEAIGAQLETLKENRPARDKISIEPVISSIAGRTERLRRNPLDQEAINGIAEQLEALKEYQRANYSAPGFWSIDRKAANNSTDARLMRLIHGLIADCTSQTIGGFFAIVGLGFGIVIVRRGVRLEPR